MKLSVRLIVVLFCAALVISMPFFFFSPSMLSEAREALTDSQEEDDGGVDLDFGRLFMPFCTAYFDTFIIIGRLFMPFCTAYFDIFTIIGRLAYDAGIQTVIFGTRLQSSLPQRSRRPHPHQ